MQRDFCKFVGEHGEPSLRSTSPLGLEPGGQIGYSAWVESEKPTPIQSSQHPSPGGRGEHRPTGCKSPVILYYPRPRAGAPGRRQTGNPCLRQRKSSRWRSWRRFGPPCSRKIRRVVLCHGAFDLLYAGTIRHFRQAKELGDVLMVVVVPDDCAAGGLSRLLFNQELRVETVAALSAVDYAAIGKGLHAVEAIQSLRPMSLRRGRKMGETMSSASRRGRRKRPFFARSEESWCLWKTPRRRRRA